MGCAASPRLVAALAAPTPLLAVTGTRLRRPLRLRRATPSPTLWWTRCYHACAAAWHGARSVPTFGLRAPGRSGLRDDALSLKAGVARRRRIALSTVSSS